MSPFGNSFKCYFGVRIISFESFQIAQVFLWSVKLDFISDLFSHLLTIKSFIVIQTGVHGFDSRTPHKPVVSKTSEADIWLSSYDHLTDIGGQGGGCQQLSQRKGAFFLLNKKEA